MEKISLQPSQVETHAFIHLVELTYLERYSTGWIYIFKSMIQIGERDFCIKFRGLYIWIKCGTNITILLREEKIYFAISYFYYISGLS